MMLSSWWRAFQSSVTVPSGDSTPPIRLEQVFDPELAYSAWELLFSMRAGGKETPGLSGLEPHVQGALHPERITANGDPR